MEGPSVANAMEINMTKYRTAGLALAGILAITAASVTDASAQWRRHHNNWGPGIAAGVATGALIGAAVASRPYYGGYYGGYGYYAEPVYAAPYAYDAGPTFYSAPVYGTYGYSGYGGWSGRICEEGYRRVPCDGPSR